ncbi:MAG TPA: bifunctional diaminohydroxyphosphoribosylaminopyrimidine deaminase/5-amino-6-(5-phosphoribosylamino)uracil reductase RibD [Gemmatimonadaceae bacterium]|nr:bifunctional diaminohydroxyphosphoribosylaminopyrimidine deaminase/5-amino-6-(5-phosphoribosylamino)uracil reductase RibD [Gemmatimonadaceae bacterium]
MPDLTRSAHEETFMRRALALAHEGWGETAPNPMVGAVVVRDGAVVGEGFHERYGDAHAEVNALRAAGDRARGATLYVTLEPCRHVGKTPPCTDAILAAGVARVVIASMDPTSNAGGGAALLREAGVAVETGVLREGAEELNASFFHAAAHDTPWTTLKLAVSAEAAISDARGSTTHLTGEESRAEVHRLRAGHDAIAVGVGTILADDPMLTVRGVRTPRVPLRRVIFDRSLRTPLDAIVVRTAAETPTIIVTRTASSKRAPPLRDRGVELITASDLPGAFRALRSHGIRSLLVEGGARIATAVLEAGLAHRLIIFQAPVLLGPRGLHAFDGATAASLAELERYRVLDRRQFGADIMTIYAVSER